MGKISRYANIYDTKGNLLRHVDEDGYLNDMTMFELEELVNKLGEDTDEKGHIKDRRGFDNAMSLLLHQYDKFGNPHEQEILEKLQESSNTKTAETEVVTALEDIEPVITPEEKEKLGENYEMDKYIDFTEAA